MKPSERLEHINEYYFSTKLKEISDLQQQGKNIINLGIGSPDLPPPKEVIDALKTAIAQDDKHSYQNYRGIAEFRLAISDFYCKHYKVRLNPETEVLPLMGSKEGIMHISMTFLNKGDKVLLPDPGYMTYAAASLLAGGKPIYYALNEKNNWLPDLEQLEKQDLSKVKLMWINYPHMPTGATASKMHFQAIIDFAKQHDILIINDNPYSFILNKNYLSILKVSGARNHALELNSLSKSHNMAGWRVGMLVGSKKHIDSVMKFKSNMDSGMFYGTQQAAIAALNMPDKWYQKINKIYSRRKKIALKILDRINAGTQADTAGMFVWAKLPKGVSSKEMSDKLLYEKNIFVAPGFIFGKNSDNYIRISLSVNEKLLTKALERL